LLGSQHVPGTALSHTLFNGVHLAKPKIQTKFIEIFIDTMMKIRKYFIHAFVAIRYSVIANEVLLVVVAMMPNVATRIV
jgi:hypothetical protein